MYFQAFASVLCLAAILCSTPINALDARLVSGVVDGQYPYQVSLKTVSNANVCSGSIITRHWILTAAHCLDGIGAFQIMVGSVDYNSGTSYGVYGFRKHYFYNPIKLTYDAGLVRTIQRIIFSSTVKPIRPEIVHPLPGATGVTTGWQSTNQLQSISTKYIGYIECNQKLSTIVDISQMCTLRTNPGLCLSDSGAPFVINNAQVGIQSYTDSCPQTLPDVYANVPLIWLWIKFNTLFKKTYPVAIVE